MENFLKRYFRLLAEDRDHEWLAGMLYPCLELASRLFGCAGAWVRFCYEKGIFPRKKLPFPLVSVGNLTWGGSGKTPLVEYLARRVAERRKKSLILTRGYSHDETEQLKNHLPNAMIGVGRHRYRTGKKLAEKNCLDLGILDDGLQHWPLRRDLEIVSVNGLNPFGNGKLIPRGILREPLTALKRASVVVIMHANLLSPKELTELRLRISEVAPKVPIAESFLVPLFFYRARKRQRLSLERLQNQRVTTFSGIGNPRSFQLILTQHQIKAVRNFEFIDHHPFSAGDLEEIKRVSEGSSCDEIVTTEKDFYRAPKLITDILNPLVLATKLRIAKGEDEILGRLIPLLGVYR